jgi:hypothetical protein
MGAKPNLTICAYCGKIAKRTDETTSFIKCRTCQKKGNNTLLPLDKWNKRKMLWLRKLKGSK